MLHEQVTYSSIATVLQELNIQSSSSIAQECVNLIDSLIIKSWGLMAMILRTLTSRPVQEVGFWESEYTDCLSSLKAKIYCLMILKIVMQLTPNTQQNEILSGVQVLGLRTLHVFKRLQQKVHIHVHSWWKHNKVNFIDPRPHAFMIDAQWSQLWQVMHLRSMQHKVTFNEPHVFTFGPQCGATITPSVNDVCTKVCLQT